MRGSSKYLRYAARFDTLIARFCHHSSSHVHCVTELNGASRPGSGAACHIGRYTNGSKVRHSRPSFGISEPGALIRAPIVRKTSCPWMPRSQVNDEMCKCPGSKSRSTRCLNKDSKSSRMAQQKFSSKSALRIILRTSAPLLPNAALFFDWLKIKVRVKEQNRTIAVEIMESQAVKKTVNQTQVVLAPSTGPQQL